MDVAGLQPEIVLRQGKRMQTRRQATRLIKIFAILICAMVPPLLVIQDRWRDQPLDFPRLHAFWCRSAFACQLTLPPYILLVLLCFVGVVLLITLSAPQAQAADFIIAFAPSKQEETAVSSRQLRFGALLILLSVLGLLISAVLALAVRRVPSGEMLVWMLLFVVGWLLRGVAFGDIATIIRRYRAAATTMLVLHLAVVGYLAAYFAYQNIAWIFLLFFITLFTQTRSLYPLPLVFWLFLLSLIAYSLALNGWWFAVIGDEYIFYRFAYDIAEQQRVLAVLAHLFDGQAVYGTHPYLSSLLQAISITWLGIGNVGWRFSNIYLSAAALLLYYSFFKTFLRARVALLSVFILATSHYIMSFGKIGYNNLQAYFALACVLAATAWAIRAQSPATFALAGMAYGLCFYVFPAAIYALPTGFILLAMYFPPLSRKAIQRWCVLACGMGMWLLPLLFQPGYWQAKLPGTLFNNPQIVQQPGGIAHHLVTNIIYALVSFLYIPEESHFVVSSYVDPLTALFVPIGFVVLLKALPDRRFRWFLFATFALLVVLVGASHDRAYPSATRMFLLLPWFALFAAAGFVWVGSSLRALGLARRPLLGLATAALLLVLLLNLYQAYVLSPQRMAGRYQSVQVVFLGVTQRVLADARNASKRFVFINDPKTLDMPSFREMLQIYYIAPEKLREIVAVAPNLTEADSKLIADPDALVALNPQIPADWQAGYTRTLAALGKTSCVARTTTGTARFTIWYDPSIARVCE